jgi:hypothetical protein
LKVNLIVYENDILQVTSKRKTKKYENEYSSLKVTGSSFFLWVLECFHQMAAQVTTILTQVTSSKHSEISSKTIFRKRTRLMKVLDRKYAKQKSKISSNKSRIRNE